MESRDYSTGTKGKAAHKFVILIPTINHFNEIEDLLFEIKSQIPENIHIEIIIIKFFPKTRNSEVTPGSISKILAKKTQLNPGISDMNKSMPVSYITCISEEKIPAMKEALKLTACENIILMNGDFSDPPQMLPKMMKTYLNNGNCILIAKKDAESPFYNERKNLDENLTTKLGNAQNKFYSNIEDLFSNYVVFPRSLINEIPTAKDAKEFSTSLENSGYRVLEIHYAFRSAFRSDTKPQTKFSSLAVDYIKSILYYYRHGTKSNVDTTNTNYKNSVMFVSKAIRFYTVGASGLLINYIISSFLSNGVLLDLWYMQATLVGILASVTSNFLLNKAWTFQDRNFSLYYTLRQFLFFLGISCFAALIQLGLVYIGVEGGSRYWTSLLFSIVVASISNFLLNKKFTFNERLWA